MVGNRRVFVVKRDGTRVEWDSSKVRRTIKWATEEIDGVDPQLLEEKFSLLIKDGIETTEIQQMLIDTAEQLIDEESPNWTLVKGRLINMDLNKRIRYNMAKILNMPVNRKFGYGSIETRVKVLRELTKLGVWDSKVLDKYTDDELAEFVSMYDEDWENSLDPIVLKSLEFQYLATHKNDVVELPQEAYLGVALTIASVFEDKAFRNQLVKDLFKHFVKERTISPATPILSNLRTLNFNGTSCEVIAIGDNLKSINYSITKLTEDLSAGRGFGVYVGKIRAKSSAIKGKWGVAGGSLPYIKIIDACVAATDQLDIRQGNANVTMDIWHFDIGEFIQAKDINGDHKKKVSTIFRSVSVPDLFFERVRQKGKWSLFDPYEIRQILGRDLADFYGKEFEEKYKMLEKMGENRELHIFKQVNAIKLFMDIIDRIPEIGDPFFFFRDRVNEANANKHKGVIYSGNLCMEFLGIHTPFKDDGNPVEHQFDGRYETIKWDLEDSFAATCHLSSLNFNKICDLSDEELEKVARLVVTQLNAVMELTFSSNPQSTQFDKIFRKIGIGYIGYAHALARHNLIYGTPEALKWTEEKLERITYYVIKASMEATEQFGVAPAFYGSDWEKGIFFGRPVEQIAKEGKLGDKWIELANQIKEKGMANTGLFAIAPNTGTSAVMGETASIMPIKSPIYEKSGIFGSETVVVPEYDKHRWSYNPSSIYTIDLINQYLDTYALFQKWVDMGISMEVPFFSNKHDTKFLAKFIIQAWKKGIKTTYYTRPTSYVCIGCAN